MNIGALSKLTSASPRSIRHYEKMELLAPNRSDNGYRVYNNSHIKIINEIQWLLEAGITLKNIKYIVPCTLQKTEILMCKDLQNLFITEMSNIDIKIKSLLKSKKILNKTLKNSVLVQGE
jgi:DNA-binding transcriptional MerR regulator